MPEQREPLGIRFAAGTGHYGQLEAWLSGDPLCGCFAANPTDWRIAAVLARIEARFSDSRFSLDEAARHVGLSRWHLERLLRVRTGKSFTCHVLEVRLRQAQMLLRDRSRSVKEVAYSTGFGSLRSFDRHFRRIHGVPPCGWRSG
jgi:two-component system response regulator YesN